MTFFSSFKAFHKRVMSQLISSLTTLVMMIGLVLLLAGGSPTDKAMAISFSDGPDMGTGFGSSFGSDVEHSDLSLSLAEFGNAGLVSYLPPGNAITDGRALLRYSLPIQNKPIRKVQGRSKKLLIFYGFKALGHCLL